MKAILFDFDGTLVDTIDLIVASWQYATEKHLGYRIERETVLPTIGRGLVGALEELAPGKGQQLYEAYQEHNMEWHDRMAKLTTGTVEMLTSLRQMNVLTGVVTAKRHATLQMGLRLFNMAGHFDVLIGFEDTTRHKPDPDPVLTGLQKLGLEPSREATAYVGDAGSDIAAGQAAGVYTIGVPWGAGTREALSHADTIIESWDDLLALVRENRLIKD